MSNLSIELAHVFLKDIERRHSLGKITTSQAKTEIGLACLLLAAERESPALAAYGAFVLLTA